MKLKFIILLPIFLLLSACNVKRVEPSKVMIQNVYGEVVSWKSFPIVFSFHKNFPVDKQEVVRAEMAKFNALAGLEVFRITWTTHSDQETALQSRRPNGVNTIYWDFNIGFGMDSGEQGKATVYWVGSEIKESDINIQSSTLTDLDFATLIRHELFHTLGSKHISETLMSPSLPPATVREWNMELIQAWKRDVETYAQVKFPLAVKESTALASTGKK